MNYYPNLEFTIEYAKGKNTNIEKPLTQSVRRAELCRIFVKSLVQNPVDVDVFGSNVQSFTEGKNVIQKSAIELRAQTVSVTDEVIPDYIIITNSALKSSFQPLADWKTKKGIFTIIVTTEEINTNFSGSDLQEKIKNYLINVYNKWGAGLYVLLGGDINVVPSRYVKGVSDALFYPTDRYYATSASVLWSVYSGNIFNGNTSLSIINIIGRIPVSNAQETTTYINKVITYEKANGLGNLNYLKNNLYADAYLEYNSNGGLTNFFHLNIKNYVSSYVSNTINNKFICDNAACTGNINRYTANGSDCSNGHTNGHLELNKDNFLSAMNTGANLNVDKFHFIYHLDHSAASGMGTSSKDKGQSINKNDMDNLTNGTSYQILMSGGCNPANFKYDCIAKRYLVNSNGGGVAFIGNTDVGWQGEEYQVRDFSNAIYNTAGHPSIGRYDIGSAFQNVCTNTTSQRWRLHLLGDPEMQVWTNTPQTLNVTVSPSAIQVGQRSVNVVISNLPAGENALICVQKGTEVYETKTINANGTYTIPFTVETAGTIHVTVTAHNYFPVEKTVTVNTSTASNPVISFVNFVDNGTNGSIGNGNGKNDAGETIRLQVTVKNTGINTANNLTATLGSTSGYITVLANSAGFGSITSGNTATDEFLYRIDKDSPEILANVTNPVQFQLEIKDASNTTWTHTFNIDVFNTDLKQRNKTIVSTSNGDLIIGANETVTFNIELQNVGQAPATGLTAVLTCSNAGNIVSSCSATPRNYPIINRFETKPSSTTFQFATGSAYTTSTTLNFTLTVTNTFGKTWSFPFNLTKPNGITGLDFTAAATGINLKWNTLSNTGGYNIYRCNVGTAAVSLSGMEGDAVRILAWTSLEQKNLFPVTMTFDGIGRGINVLDINNDGYDEIFLASKKGLLIGLDYNGNELFDIDNNVTTYSGFIDLGIPIWGIPAIGDLSGNGSYQIIESSRTLDSRPNKLFIVSSEDGNNDGKPDIIAQTATNPADLNASTGAVLANIDSSADNSLEIIVSYENGSVIIYNANGTVRNNTLYASGNPYGAIAVADLDNDGYMEIIRAGGDGIYIWRHDGSNFIPNLQPVYSIAGTSFLFRTSVTICDIDNDGNKEILVVAQKQTSPYQGKIYAIKSNGTLVQNWALPVFNHDTNSSSSIINLSVGDLNNDGNLEIAMAGNNFINIYNKQGQLLKNIPVANLSQSRGPILAEIDGDPELEIIVTSPLSTNIFAYKMNGNKVLGFPK
ncbi:hypothetical protein FACS189437_02420 [Bacteroidia bacterium]|nr:hypothetical protein FACS189437_02420 [Bacteroidia bacterium]